MHLEHKIALERADALLNMFKIYSSEGLEKYISKYYQGLVVTVSGHGLNISEPVLVDAVMNYYADIERYKKEYGFSESKESEASSSRINDAKIGAFTTYWLAVKKPIYDSNSEEYAIHANLDFAFEAGLSAANIDIMAARSYDDRRFFDQLNHVLASGKANPDLLVPVFELMQKQFPLISS